MSACSRCGTDDRNASGKCRECRRNEQRRYVAKPNGRANHTMASRKHRNTDPIRHWLSNMRWRAKKEGRPFDLTAEDIVVPDRCPLLGIPLVRSSGLGAKPNSPSVDKVIPELGYVRGNVRVISYLANAMKNSATPDQLRTFAANVPAYLESVPRFIME